MMEEHRAKRKRSTMQDAQDDDDDLRNAACLLSRSSIRCPLVWVLFQLKIEEMIVMDWLPAAAC